MMPQIDSLIDKMRQREHLPAVCWRGNEYSYGWLVDEVDKWVDRLNRLGIGQGSVCGVKGEYSPQVCALFFALMKIRGILVPFTHSASVHIPEYSRLAGLETIFTFASDDSWIIEPIHPVYKNDLVTDFLHRQHPGLVVFTSGSSGEPKGILHDCEMVLRKFNVDRPGYRTILFLLIDHFGGFNTLLSVFAYGGLAIIPSSRSPEEVCRAIENAQAELLPVTPTFLNLLLASKSYEEFDLSSTKLVTYGTEVMPEALLNRFSSIFPSARLQQTYGLSELGVLRSKSKGSDSVWVKVGGQGFETKIVGGMLYVRSESAMVGYINAPSPFDSDGWMNTGDMVEVEGDYLRILGRESDVINVGGQKVFPAEVEAILITAKNVQEATVYGTPNSLMGSIVAAQVSLETDEELGVLKRRLRKFCLDRLAPYKVPVKFAVVSQDEQQTERAKKKRHVAE